MKDRFEVAAICSADDVPAWFMAVRAVQSFSVPSVLDDRLYWLIRSQASRFLSTLIHGTRQFINSILQSGIVPAGAAEIEHVPLTMPATGRACGTIPNVKFIWTPRRRWRTTSSSSPMQGRSSRRTD